MPYVTQGQRHKLDPIINRTRFASHVYTEGDLNYLITQLAIEYCENEERESYATYNAVMGALESAKLEFYRKRVVPYEDKKAEENGEVY